MSKALNLKGQKLGRLTVITRSLLDKHLKGQTYWICECECGTLVVVRGSHLASGKVVSCGCYAKDLHTKHGYSNKPEYRAYYNMIKRCEYENDARYADYGGRGIKVCQEWRNSFERFLQDMGPRPSNRHSIDRIDVNGNYSPENCRWAVIEEQERNKRVRKDSLTGIRGVVINQKTDKYVAQIYTNGKIRRIGTYKTLKKAAEARKEIEKECWKEVMPR